MIMADWRSGRRRRYSLAFKKQVLAEASAPGVSVSAVARRHGLNANLVFNWRRCLGGDPASAFAPVVIDPSVPEFSGPASGAPASNARMEVICHGGRRIGLGADFDSAALRRLLALVEGQ